MNYSTARGLRRRQGERVRHRRTRAPATVAGRPSLGSPPSTSHFRASAGSAVAARLNRRRCRATPVASAGSTTPVASAEDPASIIGAPAPSPRSSPTLGRGPFHELPGVSMFLYLNFYIRHALKIAL